MLNDLGRKLNGLDIDRNFYALILIDEGKGELTQQELADLLESDKVSVVRVVDYLSAKGYVMRLRKQADKRKYGLLLTEKAQMELPRIREAIAEVVAVAFQGVSDKEKENLVHTLDIIHNNLKNKG